MTSLIGIIKYVYNVLSLDTDITDIVSTNIFPVIIPELNDDDSIPFPNIVMERTALRPEYSKGCKMDNAEVQVVCWSLDYIQSIDLIEKIRLALEQVKGQVDDIIISDCRIEDMDEGWEEPAYYQRIIFNFK